MPRKPRALRAKQIQADSGAPADQPIAEQIAATEREEREYDLRDLAVELVKQELARCETEIQFGPGRTGWRSNESKRAPLKARIELLQELLARAEGEPEETEETAEA